MRRKYKTVRQYIPEVTREQILAYEQGKPETYTQSELVNAVLEACSDRKVLVGGHIADYIGVDSRLLAYALEVITDMNTSSLRAMIIAELWHKHKKLHPEKTVTELAHIIGFDGASAIAKFMHRNKARFPELYLDDELDEHYLKALVNVVMPRENRTVKRLFAQLPFKGGREETEACLRLLYVHGRHVADLAMEIARSHKELFKAPLGIVEDSCLLHNIGIVWTDMPELHCHGKMPYIQHGEAGGDFLSRHRQSVLSLVANCHLGAGISFKDIHEKDLPLYSLTEPERPLEKLVCYASCFYSAFAPNQRRTVEEVRLSLAQYGTDAVQRFDEMHRMFG